MTARRQALVALGSNLGDRRALLDQALAGLVAELGPLIAVSSWHETPALAHPDEPQARHPPFLNGVALLATALTPLAVLDRLQALERAAGRDRAAEDRPWQPRRLDLDLLDLGGQMLETPRLVLPHPRLHQRRFVLAPLVEIAPGWIHPRLGLSAAELMHALAAANGPDHNSSPAPPPAAATP